MNVRLVCLALAHSLCIPAVSARSDDVHKAAIGKAAAFGPADWRYGQALNNYAAHLFERGDYTKATELYLQAIAVFRAGGDRGNLSIANCNLAVLYRTTGQYPLAIERGLEGLAIAAPGAASPVPHAITCQANLAEAYRNAGDFQAAEKAARTAVEWSQGLEGGADLRAAHALHTIANVLHSTERSAEAREICARAVQIRREKLGPRHPLLATTLGTQASVLLVLGDVQAAESAAREAVDMLEFLFGDGSVHLIGAWNNLAQVHRARNRAAEAEPLYRKALDMARRYYGAEHPDHARLMVNLAGYYREIGRLRSAEELYRKASVNLRRSLGESHPAFVQSREGLATVYRLLGRKTEAASVEKSLVRTTSSFR